MCDPISLAVLSLLPVIGCTFVLGFEYFFGPDV